MRKLRSILMGAAAVGVLMPAAVNAQDVDDEIVVTGIRGSLKNSIDVKRNADSVVDSISAEDVGKFPDTNLAESLQRITGVAIDRSGGEGQFVTVRGLGPEFVGVFINGRTIATDNPGREFSFDVLSSNITSRLDVLKTPTPDRQSGGIGGQVNIITARPLDTGTAFSISGAGIYDTLRDGIGPQADAVASWANDSKTLGLLVGVSYSDRRAQEDSSFTNGFALRSGDTIVDAPESSSGLTADDLGELPDGARVQQQVVHSRDVQDRQRLTINATAQIAPSDNFTFTLDGLYTRFDIDSNATQFSGFFSPPFIDPILDENGTVVSFSRPGVTFQDRNPLIAPQVGLSQNDNVLTSNNRLAETIAIGGNFDFDVTETLNLKLDASYSKATGDGTNPFVVLGALAPESPLIQLSNDDGISTITNIVGATDRSIQRLHFVNVNRTDIDDEVFEIRFDGDWNIERGALRAIGFGGIVTDRSKTQNTFDNFSPTQGGPIFCAYCGYTVAFDTSILSEFSFDGFLEGVPGAETVPQQTLTASIEDAFRVLNDTANINNPLRLGSSPESNADLIARRDANADSIFGFYEPDFNPGASFEVDETVYAAYFNSQWGGDFGGALPWSANAGFRVAITETLSRGVDQPVLEFRESPGDTQLLIDFGPTSPVEIDNRYINFLPSFNIKVEPTDNTIVRFAFSETLTRPTLTELGVANTFGGRSNAPISGGGNPFLEAFESTNYDVAFEYYFGETGAFTVTGFHKEFENFIELSTLPIDRPVIFPAGNGGRTEDETVLVPFQDTRSRNGETGTLTGVEVAFQTQFTGLPGIWNGFGTQLNYTYVTSEVDRDLNSPTAGLGFNGLTPHTINIVGFYEKGPISARVAYNYRDQFLVLAQSNFSEPREREAFGQLDFAASYAIRENFQFFVEGINVLGADTRDFSRFQNRLLTYSNTGSRYLFGVRASF
ncbi:MAG: TonB-dependent receptor [Pseudomonadota bacterium]